MKLRIEVLQPSFGMEARLRGDGWKLASDGTNCLMADNSQIQECDEARLHLHRLGLLTSRAVRIEFPVLRQ